MKKHYVNSTYLMCVFVISSQKKSTDNSMTSFERQLIGRRKQLQKKAKSVRFEDFLDDAATGYVGGLRRKFKADEQKTRLRKEVLVLSLVSRYINDQLIFFISQHVYCLAIWLLDNKLFLVQFAQLVARYLTPFMHFAMSAHFGHPFLTRHSDGG